MVDMVTIAGIRYRREDAEAMGLDLTQAEPAQGAFPDARPAGRAPRNKARTLSTADSAQVATKADAAQAAAADAAREATEG